VELPVVGGEPMDASVEASEEKEADFALSGGFDG